MKHAVIAAGLSLCLSSPVFAQEPFNIAVPVQRLASTFADLYGPGGLIVESLTVLPKR